LYSLSKIRKYTFPNNGLIGSFLMPFSKIRSARLVCIVSSDRVQVNICLMGFVSCKGGDKASSTSSIGFMHRTDFPVDGFQIRLRISR
jgi:hypothetical protein